MTDRTFTYLVPAVVHVSIQAPTEEAAFAQFNADLLWGDFAIEFPTGDGHRLHDLTIENPGELSHVDGQEPLDGCDKCPGHLVESRCTSAEHPA